MSLHLACLMMVSNCSLGQILIEKADSVGAKKGVEYSALKDSCGDPLPKHAVARLGSLRFHSSSGITTIAFSSDGKQIMVCGMPSQALSFSFWDTATGKEAGRFDVKDGGELRHVRQALLLPDDQTIAVCREGSVDLFERRTGVRTGSLSVDQEKSRLDVSSMAISPDGKLLAAGNLEWLDDNPIRVWDAKTGKLLEPVQGEGGQSRLADVQRRRQEALLRADRRVVHAGEQENADPGVGLRLGGRDAEAAARVAARSLQRRLRALRRSARAGGGRRATCLRRRGDRRRCPTQDRTAADAAAAAPRRSVHGARHPRHRRGHGKGALCRLPVVNGASHSCPTAGRSSRWTRQTACGSGTRPPAS